MRAAAARAAIRLGDNNNIFEPGRIHAASSSAGGTRVVLPAPGGATNTAAFRSRSASSKAGNASSTGNMGDA
jgi:hypothetical protein